jgi:hypothetical protein
MPQFSGSVWNADASRQPVPHVVFPAGHIARQIEFEQNGMAAGHCLPQPPQFAPSAAVLTQDVPHAVAGAEQVQAPLVQVCMAPHAGVH